LTNAELLTLLYCIVSRPCRVWLESRLGVWKMMCTTRFNKSNNFAGLAHRNVCILFLGVLRQFLITSLRAIRTIDLPQGHSWLLKASHRRLCPSVPTFIRTKQAGYHSWPRPKNLESVDFSQSPVPARETSLTTITHYGYLRSAISNESSDHIRTEVGQPKQIVP
jgi:hypothetical protein